MLALLVPAAAFAAAEFTLGGFVKLDSFWDSTQAAKNLNSVIQRNNNRDFHHGRMKFTAQGSRFNLTIKGPNLWGAKTSGYIEMDFDTNESPNIGGQTASNSYTPRLRHAMFRFNWPTTELLFGQYWSMFCEFYPESVQDGPMQGHGQPTARLAQVRVSQQFGDGFTIAGLVGQPNHVASFSAASPNYTTTNNGENSETPQIQGKLQYQKDLWGKAAYYGAPMPFTARVIGGYQRNVYRTSYGAVGGNTFGQNTFGTPVGIFGNSQYLAPWMAMANVFIPVIPTHSANLAGTMSLSAQWYIGQGLGAFGEGLGNGGGQSTFAEFTATNVAQFGNTFALTNNYKQKLYSQYGGYVSAQYYFTNQWFTNVTWGMSKIYGASQNRFSQLVSGANLGGYAWAGADQARSWQEVDFTLWYRPIQAFKFGLQYAFSQAYWMQTLGGGTAGVVGLGTNSTNSGTGHRVEFVGFFYF